MRSRAVLLLSLAAAGCGSFDGYALAKARAPDDLGCPAREVTQAYSARHDYAFHGCGRYVSYRCAWTSGGGAQCRATWLGADPRLSADSARAHP